MNTKISTTERRRVSGRDEADESRYFCANVIKDIVLRKSKRHFQIKTRSSSAILPFYKCKLHSNNLFPISIYFLKLINIVFNLSIYSIRRDNRYFLMDSYRFRLNPSGKR